MEAICWGVWDQGDLVLYLNVSLMGGYSAEQTYLQIKMVKKYMVGDNW